MASSTWSGGTRLVIPARAIWAADMASIAPMTFRLTQGTSTSPPTGSHTRPSRFFTAMAQASAICSGVPPWRWTSAAAAMAAAEPISA